VTAPLGYTDGYKERDEGVIEAIDDGLNDETGVGCVLVTELGYMDGG
jgi:hypothetical protein